MGRGSRIAPTYAVLLALTVVACTPGDGLGAPAVDEVAAHSEALLIASEEATLTLASFGEAGAYLGVSVAVAADGSRAIAGAIGHDTTFGSTAGSARVFLRVGSSWAPEALLSPSGGGAFDRSGVSVALTSDADRALVGVPWRDGTAGTDLGAAVAYVRSGTTWTEESALVASDGEMGDLFGRSVALSADGSRALVGAPEDDTAAGADAGSARVFVRAGSAWTEEATLTPVGAVAGERFGFSVALSSDASRAVVGAPSGVTASGGTGSARVFVRSGTTWMEEVTLTSASGADGDGFGFSVALSADGSRALVGAPKDDTTIGSNAGTAHVFLRTGASWSPEATLSPAGGLDFDLTGSSVALSPDGRVALLGQPAVDGLPTFGSVVAASRPGRAVVFSRTGVVWAEDVTLAPSDGESRDGGGFSVALTSDGGRALIGVPRDNTPRGGSAGSVRVFGLAPPDPDGAACTTDTTCLSGFCVDGFCCESACGSPDDCQACSGALTGVADGICAPVPDCCTADGDCDDTTDCTSDTCDTSSNRCTYSPIAGCCATDDDCADADACTTDTCETSSGLCERMDVPACCSTDGDCDDGDRCTTDSCPAAGSMCVFEPVVGCCATDADCDDGDPCTIDACDAVTGSCETTPAPSCDAADASTDTSMADGGADPGMDAGCGCATPSRHGPRLPLSIYVIIVVARLIRRRG